MKTFTISQKCPVMFGPGASLLAADKFVELGCKKIMVCTDAGVQKLGIPEPIIKSLEDKGLEVLLFDEVTPDPSDVLINKAGDIYKNGNCDGLLAIGGGSVMDTAKGVKVLSKNPGQINQYYGRKPMEVGDPMILISTTVGTGSEVSIASVIFDTTTGLKPAILNTAIQSDLSIMDCSIHKNLPKFVTACSIMDIFEHALETITSTYRNMNSTIMAKAALEICVKYADAAMKEGTADEEAYYMLGFASSYVALAFNDAMIHVGHHIAHTLGAYFHTAHGECCSIVAPAFCKYFADKMPEEMKDIAGVLGLNPESETLGQDMSDWIKAFTRKLGLRTAKELDYDFDKMLTMLDYVHGRVVEPNSTTPFDVTKEDITTILEDIYNA